MRGGLADMALEENGQVAINNVSSVTLRFDHAISSVIMWSADDSFYIKHDGDATTSHFLHPQDSPISYGVPCRTIGLLAQNQAAGIVHYIAIKRTLHITPDDEDFVMGGIDV